MAENLNDEALRREVRAELSRVEEDATYTSKAHFEAADRWSGVHLWVGMTSALMAALAGASAWKNQPEIASVLALVSGALTAVLTFLNPQSRHGTHQQAGARFVALRNEARLMRQVELLATASAALPDLVTRLKDLSKRYSDANAASPLIPRHAYRSAARGIREGQARHAVDHRPAPPAVTP